MPRKKKNLRVDKRFCVRLDLGKDGEGKRVRKSFYSYDSLEDAELQRDEYIRLHPADSDANDREITLSKWSARWLRIYKSGLANNTIDGYKTSVNSICAFKYTDDKGASINLGDMKMTDIRQYHLQAYITNLKNKSKSTIHIANASLKQIFESAIDNHIIVESPIKRLKLPVGSYTGHRALDDWEKELIKKTWRNHRGGVWAMLMLFTGMRRGEMAALTWDSIDLKKKVISIINSADLKHGSSLKETKTTAGIRELPILHPLYLMLEEIRPNDPSGRICLSVEGRQLTESAYDRGWEGYMLVLERAANGIEPYEKTKGWRTEKARAKEGHIRVSMNAHDLRYTYATMLYDLDVDVKTAQYLMGHTDLETTMKIYTQLSGKKKLSSIEKLVSHFDIQEQTQESQGVNQGVS